MNATEPEYTTAAPESPSTSFTDLFSIFTVTVGPNYLSTTPIDQEGHSSVAIEVTTMPGFNLVTQSTNPDSASCHKDTECHFTEVCYQSRCIDSCQLFKPCPKSISCFALSHSQVFCKCNEPDVAPVANCTESPGNESARHETSGCRWTFISIVDAISFQCRRFHLSFSSNEPI